MHRTILLLLLVAFAQHAIAQFGAAVKYQSLNSQWEEPVEENFGEFQHRLLTGSLYYWFRLKDKRIEFLPEVSLSKSIGGDSDDGYRSRLGIIGLAMNVDFYVFDLISDCDCPTFSKEGSVFTRGFFLEATAGVDFGNIALDTPSDKGFFESSSTNFKAGLGAGLDIGLSDLVTLTPLIYIHWTPTPSWDGLDEAIGLSDTGAPSGSDWYTGAGIRVLFRPDYKRRYR